MSAQLEGVEDILDILESWTQLILYYPSFNNQFENLIYDQETTTGDGHLGSRRDEEVFNCPWPAD